jgi:hypothetical protein
MKDYKCYLISNKPQFYKEISNNLSPEELEFFDGTNAGSFSKLVNKCAASCPNEIVIMMSDKMRPSSSDVQKMLSLIRQGFAFVGMYRFGFFGFKKELMRQIGMMDERYVGGGWEDDDFYIRIKEANLSMYLSHEVPYIKSHSSWNSEVCWKYFLEKWGDAKSTGIAKRSINELSLNYDLGSSIKTNFLSWDHTQIHAKKVKRYLDLKIIKD